MIAFSEFKHTSHWSESHWYLKHGYCTARLGTSATQNQVSTTSNMEGLKEGAQTVDKTKPNF